MNFFLKYFTYTKQIRIYQQKIAFCLKILWKFVKILFKRNRKLKKKTLYFSNENVFDKSVFMFTYDFENTLYYELKGFYKSLNGQSIEIYNNQLPQRLEFIVHGFRKKETFILDHKITEIIHSEKFEAKFLKSFKVEKINLKLVFKNNHFKVIKAPIHTSIPQISIKTKNLKFNPTPYNSKDFIRWKTTQPQNLAQ